MVTIYDQQEKQLLRKYQTSVHCYRSSINTETFTAHVAYAIHSSSL